MSAALLFVLERALVQEDKYGGIRRQPPLHPFQEKLQQIKTITEEKRSLHGKNLKCFH